MPDPMTVVLTVTDDRGSFTTNSPGVTVSNRHATITPPTGTTSVTVTVNPGANVTFANALTLSVGGNVIAPATVALSSGSYVFGCTDNVTAGSSQLEYNQTLTIGTTPTTFTDPSMVFNPPGT
jgi:hypothetical protein